MNNSINIGLLVDNLDTDLTAGISKGAKVAAQQIGANLYLLPGRYLKPDQKDQRIKASNFQYNTLFDLASSIQFDLVIVLLGSIASTIEESEKRKFLQKYINAPVVTLCCSMDGYCSVMPDNKVGLEEAIVHLIEAHGAKKIGMVAGPATNQDSMERVQVFVDTLIRYGIPVTNGKIVHGNFSNHCTDVVEELMDQNPGLDAIVFANDQMAIAGYKVCEKRGLVVGQDILITGFDDDIFANDMKPPLTSVNGNGGDIGFKAVELGMQYLQTGELKNLKADSTLSRRKSCGCQYVSSSTLIDICNKHSDGMKYGSYIYGRGKAAAADERNVKFADKLSDCMKVIQHAEAVITGGKEISNEDITQINRLLAELFELGSSNKNLAGRLMDVFHIMNVEAMEDVRTETGKNALSDLYFNIFKSISEMNVRQLATKEKQMAEYSENMNIFSTELINNATTATEKYQFLFDYLNSVQLTQCALYTYEQPIIHEEGSEWTVPTNLYLTAYNDGEGVKVIADDRKKILTAAILHSGEYSVGNKHARVIMPVFSDNIQYGILIGEMASKYFEFYLEINDNVNEAVDLIMKSEATDKPSTSRSLKSETSVTKAETLPVSEKMLDKEQFYSTMHKLVERKDTQGQAAVIAELELYGIEVVEEKFGADAKHKVEKIASDILCDMYGKEGIVANVDGRYFIVSYMDKNAFLRNVYPEFQSIKQRINETAEILVDIDLNIGYVQMNISRNNDISEYLEKLEMIVYMARKTKRYQH